MKRTRFFSAVLVSAVAPGPGNRVKGMRRALVFIAVLALATCLGTAEPFAAGVAAVDPPQMNDYCVVPPYVIQNVPPNVMLLLDNSESMLKFAYAADEGYPNALSKPFYDPEGKSIGDYYYYGNQTDKVYFQNERPLTGFSEGDEVYLWVYEYYLYDCTSGVCVNSWSPGRGWRGVGSGDKIRIASMATVDGQECDLINPCVVTLEEPDGSPLGTTVPLLDEYYLAYMLKASDSVVADSINASLIWYTDWAPLDASFDPSTEYYGYFSPHYWYTYEANTRFSPSDPKEGSGLDGSRAKDADEWDGNFLNWLTMRRVDIMRKALTGGKTAAAQANQTVKRIAEPVDDDIFHGIYRRVENAQDYIDTARYSGEGSRCFYFPPGLGTASFRVDQTVDGNCSADPSIGSSSYDTYDHNLNAIEALPGEVVEGVLQKVVGARARIGLTWFDSASNGGDVVTDMDGQALESVINDINLTAPNSKTPLAEAFWTVAGYIANKKGFNDSSRVFDTTVRATGPYYTSSYGVTANEDPMNFSTGGQARYPECAKNFVLLVTDGDPCQDGSLSPFIKNFAKTGTMTRSPFNCGSPSADYVCAPASGSGYSFPFDYIVDLSPWFLQPWFECTWSGGPQGAVAGLEDVALFAHTQDLRDPSMGTSDISEKQNINLYIVNAFGQGSTLLKYAAINGGFEDANDDDKPDDPSEWDKDGDGQPDNYYAASGGAELEEAIEEAFSGMLKRASSGTAASVLASGDSEGANLIQAIFYPRRRFGNEVIRWTGSLQNLWYYLDPFLDYTTIREDTDSDDVLDKTGDRIVTLYFDERLQAARADRFYVNGNGSAGSAVDTVDIEDLNFLWEAGTELFKRDISADPRRIFVPDVLTGAVVNGTLVDGDLLPGDGLIDIIDLVNTVGFVPNTFVDYMGAADANEADRIIRYLHGEDVFLDDGTGMNTYRDRTVVIPAISNTPGVWKLADILNSTPSIISPADLGGYWTWYRDDSYRRFYMDEVANDEGWASNDSRRYKNRGMVFAGANDGMLHAFRLGKVEKAWPGQTQNEILRLTGNDLGREEWAFVPINALPYVKYYPLRDYCHIYTTDLSSQRYDVSTEIDMSVDDDGDGTPDNASAEYGLCSAADYHNCKKTERSWRTVLFGGMRYGGACRNLGSPTAEGVETPIDGVGFSSYFALDVTDPVNPEFMWEFTNPGLGFTTSGPVVVKVNGEKPGASGAKPSTDTNGKWFAVFGSGPTGPINTAGRQFMGHSDQNLKLFVVDLKTGQLLRTIDTGVGNAFSGSLFASVYDLDKRPSDYSDDVIYVGYTKKDDATGTWTKGGVIRVLTKEDPDPGNWEISHLITETGPVTSAVVALAEDRSDADRLWVHFGTGRYFYDLDNDHDDFNGQRYLYSVKDTCYTGHLERMYEPPSQTFNYPCNDTITDPGSVLEDATNGGVSQIVSQSAGYRGCRIGLDQAGTFSMPKGDGTTEDIPFAAERVITDPVAVSSTNIVFFTSLKPYDTDCGLGGRTFMWAVDGRDCGAPKDRLKGKALVQVSTGAIEEVDLSEAFTDDGSDLHRQGRRSGAMEGVPPTAQGASINVAPDPRNRVLHIIEK